MFGITVPRDLEALLKATRDVPGLNCRCYLPNISFFFLPSRQPLEPLSETTFKPGRFVVRFSSSRNLSLFLFVFVFVERKRGKSDTYDRLGHFSLYVDSMIFLVPSWIYGQRETRSISRVQRALGANSFEYIQGIGKWNIGYFYIEVAFLKKEIFFCIA